jgi:bla regulator protein blaR1
MILYVLKSSGCLLLLWAVYKLLLEGEKTHRFNRFYLLFSLAFGLLIPLVSYEVEPTTAPPILTEKLLPIQQTNAKFSQNSIDSQVDSSSVANWLLGVYGLISVFFIVRFGKNMYVLLSRIRKNTTVNVQDCTLVLLNESVLPCTFLSYIFLNKTDYDDGRVEPELLKHELCHVRQWHSVDVLLIEVLRIFFWFNPLLYLYKRAMQLNHEFLADEAVNQTYHDVRSYQTLLLQKTIGVPIQFSSSSTFQLTKQRLMMMTKHTTAWAAWLKIGATVPVFGIVAALFSNGSIAQIPQTSATPQAKTEVKSGRLTKNDVNYENGRYHIVEDFNPKSKPKLMLPKTYNQLTEAEKELIIGPIYSEKKIPTEEMLVDWQNGKKIGLWINEKRVKNSVLKNYKPSDFSEYFVSKLEKNAYNYGKHYYQVDVMTNDYYDNVYLKQVRENPSFMIDKRTKK